MLDELNRVLWKKGYSLLDIQSFPHKDDNFLKIIVAYKDKEYVCWIYNINDNALYEGFYTDSYIKALDKLKQRIS